MTKNIELWDDDNQNQIWGQLTDDNRVELRADSNDVITGGLQGNKLDLAPRTVSTKVLQMIWADLLNCGDKSLVFSK